MATNSVQSCDDLSHIQDSNKYQQKDISTRTEEFLNSDEISHSTDPKLKRERQKLSDLLESYKKLIDKLDSKYESPELRAENEKKLHRIPEIYAILHPELYKNRREEEKDKLVQKLSKRPFTDIDKVVPIEYRTPPANISDIRQQEKERLINIISSCPARFHNLCDNPVYIKKTRRPKSYSLPNPQVKDEREAEKERLSKILASSATYYRKNLDLNCRPLNGKRKDSGNALNPKQLNRFSLQKIRGDSGLDKNSALNQDTASPNTNRETDMVRVGEYSPLTSKERGKTLFGMGEHEERRNQLLAERRKEYKKYLSNSMMNEARKKEELEEARGRKKQERVDKGLSAAEEELEQVANGRCQSISTQTEDIATDNRELGLRSPSSNRTNAELQPSPQAVYYLSPRDAKLRQAAYARALQEQIEEKRRFEEERKRREKEEDELMEQRMRVQQEKIQNQVSSEQKRKEDWLAQRQSQEEVLRRKMLEMKLEAQELRKQQNRKKRHSGTFSEPRELTVTKPQTTLSEPSDRSQLEENKNTNLQLPDERLNSLRRAPLLDADRQNILSSYRSAGLPPTPLQPIHIPKAPHPNPMSNGSYGADLRLKEREKADELLRAPLDFRIDRPPSPTQPTPPKSNERPPSPPIPAIRTRDILNNNTKLLEERWQVPDGGRELNRSQLSPDDRILTQLGAFRRQLHQEHLRLEARLQNQAST